MSQKTAIIIGAGPAGLTAAYELLTRTDIKPIVLERSTQMGGISQTINYKGNRIDIGGHRFFSKSDRVMNWWFDRMPVHEKDATSTPAVPSMRQTPEPPDRSMLVRERRSRIYFLRKFFSYPLKLNTSLIRNLGLWRMFKCGMSYLRIKFFPLKQEDNLEQFFINRFGRELYKTFFKSYTEKVWGVPCDKISASWGAQRIKGLSITQAIKHALSSRKKKSTDLSQKDTETSLIEQFVYPKYGPGQMWELTADYINEHGGQVITNQNVIGLNNQQGRITQVTTKDPTTGIEQTYDADYVFSTMPIQHLIKAMQQDVPGDVDMIAKGLVYRDFLTIGLLLNKLHVQEYGKTQQMIDDNWVYIQEPDVKLGRLQIFNNWSPYMVSDPDKVWVGLEYFCNMDDEFWSMPDDALKQLGAAELAKIGFIKQEDVLDSVVIRIEKAYPAYFGTYDRFDEIRKYLDTFENLFPLGRNGMHRYNNQDHSMLTAMTAVDNILAGITDKKNIWEVNTEKTYHEEKQES